MIVTHTNQYYRYPCNDINNEAFHISNKARKQQKANREDYFIFYNIMQLLLIISKISGKQPKKGNTIVDTTNNRIILS